MPSDRHLPNTVYVEVSGTTLAKGLLHCSLLGRKWGGVIEPVGVHSTGNARKVKREASVSEVIIEYLHLLEN